MDDSSPWVKKVSEGECHQNETPSTPTMCDVTRETSSFLPVCCHPHHPYPSVYWTLEFPLLHSPLEQFTPPHPSVYCWRCRCCPPFPSTGERRKTPPLFFHLILSNFSLNLSSLSLFTIQHLYNILNRLILECLFPSSVVCIPAIVLLFRSDAIVCVCILNPLSPPRLLFVSFYPVISCLRERDTDTSSENEAVSFLSPPLAFPNLYTLTNMVKQGIAQSLPFSSLI